MGGGDVRVEWPVCIYKKKKEKKTSFILIIPRFSDCFPGRREEGKKRGGKGNREHWKGRGEIKEIGGRETKEKQ